MGSSCATRLAAALAHRFVNFTRSGDSSPLSRVHRTPTIGQDIHSVTFGSVPSRTALDLRKPLGLRTPVADRSCCQAFRMYSNLTSCCWRVTACCVPVDPYAYAGDAWHSCRPP
jgi:hypothetical protein